jgi:hypothetical protein
MKPAFNEQATMYSVRVGVGADGELAGSVIPVLSEKIDTDFRPSPDAQAAITRIEFSHLLKVEGKWTVVSRFSKIQAAPYLLFISWSMCSSSPMMFGV